VLRESAERHRGRVRARAPLYCYRNDKPVVRG
jgi:hypothetical protein